MTLETDGIILLAQLPDQRLMPLQLRLGLLLMLLRLRQLCIGLLLRLLQHGQLRLQAVQAFLCAVQVTTALTQGFILRTQGIGPASLFQLLLLRDEILHRLIMLLLGLLQLFQLIALMVQLLAPVEQFLLLIQLLLLLVNLFVETGQLTTQGRLFLFIQ